MHTLESIRRSDGRCDSNYSDVYADTCQVDYIGTHPIESKKIENFNV